MKNTLLTVLAGALLAGTAARAASTSLNFGSLGTPANGVNSDGVTFEAGALAVAGDTTAGYSGGNNTVVPFNAALNPAAGSPFTIEFWAKPSGTDNDDVPVSNRTHSGNRTGWVFFQRANAWNFRMYNGNSSTVGVGIEGNTPGNPSTVGVWNHVVAVWDGSLISLFVNGQNTGAPVTGSSTYLPSISPTSLSIGAHDNGTSPYSGLVDETAFYPSALSASQILDHYNAASSTVPGFYSSKVQADGALLYLTNNVPEPGSAGLLALGLAGFLRRRRA